jgi:hypothetical protein
MITAPLLRTHPSFRKAMADAEAMAPGTTSGRQRRGSQYSNYETNQNLNGPTPVRATLPKSLGEVLMHPQQRHRFRTYLKEMHADESLLFYESVELYTKIDDPKWSKTAASDIIKKFIHPGGVYEINIPSEIREQLLAAKKFNKQTFDEAKGEVYRLLKANFFATFVAKEFLSAGE